MSSVNRPSFGAQALVETLGDAQERGLDRRIGDFEYLRENYPITAVRGSACFCGNRAFSEEALHVVKPTEREVDLFDNELWIERLIVHRPSSRDGGCEQHRRGARARSQ
jgi:hypothetical protein